MPNKKIPYIYLDKCYAELTTNFFGINGIIIELHPHRSPLENPNNIHTIMIKFSEFPDCIMKYWTNGEDIFLEITGNPLENKINEKIDITPSIYNQSLYYIRSISGLEPNK